jgi:recombination protein RecA
MLTKKQLFGDIGDQTIGELARLMSVALPKINNAASNSKTCMIFINQTRSAIGTFSPSPGGATSTPGGRALKYFCSLRLELKKRDYIVKGEETIGQEIRVVVRKNKFGRNNGYVDAAIYYNQGFKPEDEIVDLCKSRNIIKTAGAWVYFGDLKWNGSKVLTEAVKNDSVLFESLLSEYKKSIENERTSVSIEMIGKEEEDDDNE